MSGCRYGYRYVHLTPREQNLCDVLPMEVKKLNLKDQCSISRNLRKIKSQGQRQKYIDGDLWRRASTTIAIVRLDEERGNLSDSHR